MTSLGHHVGRLQSGEVPDILPEPGGLQPPLRANNLVCGGQKEGRQNSQVNCAKIISVSIKMSSCINFSIKSSSVKLQVSPRQPLCFIILFPLHKCSYTQPHIAKFETKQLYSK